MIFSDLSHPSNCNSNTTCISSTHILRSLFLHRPHLTLKLLHIEYSQKHRASLICETFLYLLQLVLCILQLLFRNQPLKKHQIVKVNFLLSVDFDWSIIFVVELLDKIVFRIKSLLIRGLYASHSKLLQPMNFLNKKYTSLHSSSPYSHSNSRSFLPAASTVRETPPQFQNNNCQNHPNEIVRHLCIECVELLCAQCIGQHLQLHREANIIPKILSIKQMRSEMDNKLEHLINIMSKNNPAQIDVDGIRRKAIDKIDQMRKDLIKAVDQWITIMKGHLMSSLGFENIAKMKMQMQKLCEEVGLLKNALQSGSQPAIIKKVFQIDAQKLQQSYVSMFKQYRDLQKQSQFEFLINWKQIVKGFQAHINIKGRQQILQQPDYEQQSRRGSHSNSRDQSYQKQSSSKSEYRRQ